MQIRENNITLSGGSAIEESIIGEVDGFQHRNTVRHHPEHGANEFDLSLHLGQVDGGLEIDQGEVGEDDAFSDGGGRVVPLGSTTLEAETNNSSWSNPTKASHDLSSSRPLLSIVIVDSNQ